MASIDWHTSLPQELITDGYIQSAADNLLRSPMDAGPPKTRRRFTSGPRPVKGDIFCTAAQLSTFKTFYNTTLLYGALRFNWYDPDDGVTAVEMKFTAVPSWVSVIDDDYFRISLELEILP